MPRFIVIVGDQALFGRDAAECDLLLRPGLLAALPLFRSAGYECAFVPSGELIQSQPDEQRAALLLRLLKQQNLISRQLNAAELAEMTATDAVLIGSQTPAQSAALPQLQFFALAPEQITAAVWPTLAQQILHTPRTAEVKRQTKETEVWVKLELDGAAETSINTGLGFFDHMLEQLARHSGAALTLRVAGDLRVDEHHTIEDTALALGAAYAQAAADKAGLNRYGFLLPMDEACAEVALDFGGRPWLQWEVAFKREKIGDMPTEMFFHFFKSFCDAAACNLHIRAVGENEHHKAEAVFKGVGRALRQALARDPHDQRIPSTKGVL